MTSGCQVTSALSVTLYYYGVLRRLKDFVIYMPCIMLSTVTAISIDRMAVPDRCHRASKVQVAYMSCNNTLGSLLSSVGLSCVGMDNGLAFKDGFAMQGVRIPKNMDLLVFTVSVVYVH